MVCGLDRLQSMKFVLTFLYQGAILITNEDKSNNSMKYVLSEWSHIKSRDACRSRFCVLFFYRKGVVGMIYQTAVIGAGVVGALTARELRRYGVSVCVLERENDVAMGATKANSGIVHAGFDALEGSVKARMNVLGAKRMEQVCRELNVNYKKNGALVVAFDKSEMETVRALYCRGVKNGVADLVVVDREGLRELEPNLSPDIIGALYAKGSGIVCPYHLCIAAMGNAMDNGAELLLNFEVMNIQKSAGIYALSDGTRTVYARTVVNAAGLYSDQIAGLGVKASGTTAEGQPAMSVPQVTAQVTSKVTAQVTPQVTPRKGEYLLLDKEYGGLLSRTVFRTPTAMGKGILLSPTADGNLILGPTSTDIEDKEDKSVTKEGIEKIIRETLKDMPGVPLKGVITSFAGLRSVGEGGDFVLRRSGPGWVDAIGIDSPGLSSSPAIAEHIVSLLAQDGLPLISDPAFDPVRGPVIHMKELPLDEKNQMIRQNRKYGHIVCRCEEISEGEIIDALVRNPPARDLDGVKRRTRSGMGRCQGGFCSPAVAQLIAEQTGTGLNEVTKFGKGSELLMGDTK